MPTLLARVKSLQLLAIPGLFSAGLLAVAPAQAHHGTRVSYDWTSSIRLTGTVTEFVTRNPHSFLLFDVTDDNGEVVTWGAETASLGALRRNGISKNTLRPGDEITLSLYPSRAGTPRGQHILTEQTLINGVDAKTGVAVAAPNVTRTAVASENADYDPRDLSGIWLSLRRNSVTGEDGPFVIAPLAPMTPAGKAKYDSQLPSYGPRAIPPGLGNDPAGDCNPLGLVRTLVVGRPIEFLQGANKISQLFEEGRMWRTIYTDGRDFPDNLEPLWFGYSIGHWDGDTFVVETRSLDHRVWLDPYANPLSDAMRVTERWTRVKYGTLELELTLHDPKTFTEPVVSPVKAFTLQPGRDLRENICAPINESAFNEKIRDPAGGRGVIDIGEWQGETGYKEGEGQRDAYLKEAEERQHRPLAE